MENKKRDVPLGEYKGENYIKDEALKAINRSETSAVYSAKQESLRRKDDLIRERAIAREKSLQARRDLEDLASRNESAPLASEQLNLRNKGVYDDMVRALRGVDKHSSHLFYMVREGKPEDLDYCDRFTKGNSLVPNFRIEIRKDYNLFFLDYPHKELGKQRVAYTSARDLWDNIVRISKGY